MIDTTAIATTPLSQVLEVVLARDFVHMTSVMNGQFDPYVMYVGQSLGGGLGNGNA